jgi:hypothetical protein
MRQRGVFTVRERKKRHAVRARLPIKWRQAIQSFFTLLYDALKFVELIDKRLFED